VAAKEIITSKKLKQMIRRVEKTQAVGCQTFSMRETRILAKQGNVGTNGFRVIRGEAKTCRSTI
jgi:hypothetical protein